MNDPRHDNVLHATPILSLRPTQLTVGMREVERKRKAWAEKRGAQKSKTLESHMVPVVVGPKGVLYLTDHHHMLRALYEDGQKDVFVMTVGDLGKADPGHFWNLMDYHGWTHPYDEKGRRRPYDDLPKTVEGLRDDPYRALSGALRNDGGYAKDSTPFSEFVWADFFRPRIKRKDLKDDFGAALKKALVIARSKDADYLPGWCGPHDGAPSPAKRRARRSKA